MYRDWKRILGRLTDEKYLSLSLKCGIAVTGSRNSLSEALEQTKTALTAARHGKQEIMFYEELSAEEKACAADVAFAEVASLERLKEMTLSSIALNLFDRDGDTSVVLDILGAEAAGEIPSDRHCDHPFQRGIYGK